MNEAPQAQHNTNRAGLRTHLAPAAAALLSLVGDFVTKRLASARFGDEALEVLSNARFAIRFSLAHNPAGAWSMFGWAPGTPRRILFVAISTIASVLLAVWYAKTPVTQRALRLGIAFVLGGALGNLVDRVMTGSVIDFVEVSAIWGGTRHYWPTFNVADIAICVGVGLMAVDMFGKRRPEG
jgi:signal peptidase II